MEIFALLVAFQIKHFLADYPLQTPFMLQKFKTHGWVVPLGCHAGVHALGTFVIGTLFLLLTGRGMIFLPDVIVLDFVIHFSMDRIKASPNWLGKYKALSAKDFMFLKLDPPLIIESTKAGRPVTTQATAARAADAVAGNKLFWWSLGLDQMVHHLTHYAIIYLLVK